jgi:hypothetical protein
VEVGFCFYRRAVVLPETARSFRVRRVRFFLSQGNGYSSSGPGFGCKLGFVFSAGRRFWREMGRFFGGRWGSLFRCRAAVFAGSGPGFGCKLGFIISPGSDIAGKQPGLSEYGGFAFFYRRATVIPAAVPVLGVSWVLFFSRRAGYWREMARFFSGR